MSKIFLMVFAFSVGSSSLTYADGHTELHREFNILTDADILFENYYWLIMHGAFSREEYKVALIFGDYDNLAACLDFVAVLQRRNEGKRYSCKPAPR